MNGLRAKIRSNRGREWWGKRPYSGTSVRYKGMKFWKRQVHKIERQEGKKQCHENN